jgi:hypothetical protein
MHQLRKSMAYALFEQVPWIIQLAPNPWFGWIKSGLEKDLDYLGLSSFDWSAEELHIIGGANQV